MTQEQKQLVLIDLCGRLPHGVIVDYKENEFETPHWKITAIYPNTFDGWIGYDRRVGAGSETGSRPFKIGEVKPYLRPMSSMTEKEREEYRTECKKALLMRYRVNSHYPVLDWLNRKMFDYRGLIPMELASEAPEGMYKDR